MTTVCIWNQDDRGWLWDDAEDHGGFDRVSPKGPFASEQEAKQDAADFFKTNVDNLEVINRRPDYYPDENSGDSGETEMSLNSALHTVLELAAQNVLDEDQTENDPDLENERKRQEEAVDIVEKWLNHADITY